DLGNLLNRTLSMVHRYVGTNLPARAVDSGNAQDLLSTVQAWWDGVDPAGALEVTWRLIRAYNQKIDQAKPWVLHQAGEQEKLLDVLAGCCEALRWTALMIAPAMPESSREVLRQLGRRDDEGTWPTAFAWPGGTVTEPKPVFPRIYSDQQKEIEAKCFPTGAPEPTVPTGIASAPPTAPTGPPPADVSIADFAKIELRAAKVLTAERVPKADKLLKLTLDVGAAEPRTVVSGIAPAYTPETIVGRTVIYFANLAPRKIRGVLSQGMILAAGEADVLGLSALDRDVPPGTKIR